MAHNQGEISPLQTELAYGRARFRTADQIVSQFFHRVPGRGNWRKEAWERGSMVYLFQGNNRVLGGSGVNSIVLPTRRKLGTHRA